MSEESDRRSLAIIMKGHGDFHVSITELFREEKNLHIEAEALNALQPENLYRCFPAEALITALSICMSLKHNYFGEYVKTQPNKVTHINIRQMSGAHDKP